MGNDSAGTIVWQRLDKFQDANGEVLRALYHLTLGHNEDGGLNLKIEIRNSKM
jgi:hypothetical protein